MLVSRRVFKFVPVASQIFSWLIHKAPSNVNQVHVYEFRKRSIPKAAKCSQIASASFVMGLSFIFFYPADILQGTNISRTSTSWHFWVDAFPFPKVGPMASFVLGKPLSVMGDYLVTDHPSSLQRPPQVAGKVPWCQTAGLGHFAGPKAGIGWQFHLVT